MSNHNDKINDMEFRLLSGIHSETIAMLDSFCEKINSDEEIYPAYLGNVYWTLKEASLYYMVFLIRYVSTKNVSNLIEHLRPALYEEYFSLPHITNNGEELEVTINIKNPNERGI